MKISILTINPCIDRALYLSRSVVAGDIHRVERSVTNVAGKGLNQAIVLENLGTLCDYFSFGSPERDAVDLAIEAHRFAYHKTVAACGVRTNTKIIDADGIGTEFNEPGGPITEAELDELLRALDETPTEILSVCGSIPRGVEKSIYREIVKRAKQNGKIVALDADGDALKNGLEGRPDLIKPNRRELAGLFGLAESELGDMAETLRLCRLVYAKYGTSVLCTLDADGSLYVGCDGEWRVSAPKVEMRGFAGAGDTYLASFLQARYAEHLPITDALAFASRAAAAKITLEGSELPTRETIGAVGAVSVQAISS
ncbi:MAG: hypothetical protein J6R04_04730 [Clostridia bacterium]|nr:hypothetical protein [Clostridia bacterium]